MGDFLIQYWMVGDWREDVWVSVLRVLHLWFTSCVACLLHERLADLEAFGCGLLSISISMRVFFCGKRLDLTWGVRCSKSM